jgi:hypothetical protein
MELQDMWLAHTKELANLAEGQVLVVGGDNESLTLGQWPPS